ncbi:hypothetical protein [Dyadobacter sp. NIV53]|uniref:hypothetical protein n=1 Tax=Dyadobacter sp. NIV53 TaxID=2861765 RepID=UPI001C86FC95|nr:hypothetical protein [Dyadobacter sp. NIV53]
MVHEKIFNLSIDRDAKIIVEGSFPNLGREIIINLQFLIKDKNDRYFRAPIGIYHPQYWKLKKLTPEKSQMLQLEYSGISRKQLNLAIREFKQAMGPGYIFSDSIRTEGRIKGLKAIRTNTVSRRIHAAV